MARMRNTSTWVGWAAIAGLAPLGCTFGGARFWVTDEQTLTLSAASAEALNVTTDNGHITATGVEAADDIVVQVTRRAGGLTPADAQRCLQAIEIVQDATGQTCTLGWRWAGPRPPNWQACVAFDITLPARLRLEAESHNGALRLAGLNAAAELRTHNGRVVVEGHGGPLDAETHNGRIEAEGVTPTLRLVTHNGSIEAALRGGAAPDGEITTHNGSVTLVLDKAAGGRITCKTDNGAIAVDSSLTLEGSPRSAVTVVLGDGPGRLEVRTHNGGIRLR